MTVSDPIADLLTRIRNGGMAKQRFIDVSWSKMKESIANILKEQGFVEQVLVKRDGPRGTIRIFLKYQAGRRPLIQSLKRISKPGLRKYVRAQDIKPVLGGMGICIVSTSQGVKEGQEARNLGIGGELLCKVS